MSFNVSTHFTSVDIHKCDTDKGNKTSPQP